MEQKHEENIVEEEIKTEEPEETCSEEEAVCEEQESPQEPETEEVEDTESGDTQEAKKKGFFSKKKDKKDAQIEDLTDRLKRQMAEFDNFRKRTEKEKAMMYEIGVKSIVEKILPVVDNFERGLAGVDIDDNPFAEGMDKVYKQMLSTLEEIDVKPIQAVGEEFNPDYHNAVMHVEDEEYGENTIVEEFQKGYTYRESVVRHSMVKVAN